MAKQTSPDSLFESFKKLETPQQIAVFKKIKEYMDVKTESLKKQVSEYQDITEPAVG